jgi:hypothetical protein
MPSPITVDVNDLPHLVNYERIRQGDSITKTYAFQINSVAKDLSACTVTLTLEEEDGTVVIADRAITPAGGSNNEITLLITATDTASLAGLYRYEIKCVFPSADGTFPNGLTKVLVEGKINFEDVI